MNILQQQLEESDGWSLYNTDRNVFIYTKSVYNYKAGRLSTIYLRIVLIEEDSIEELSIEESWMEDIEVKNKKIALFYIEIPMETIDKIVDSYIGELPF